MKRHADQLARERELESAMQSHQVTRVVAPFMDSWLRFPGDLAVVLAVKREGGEQHNYAMKLEASEVDAMGLGEQDGWREIMDGCAAREEETRRRRQIAVDYLARKMALAMIDYLEKNDPQFGYSPKQWRELNHV